MASVLSWVNKQVETATKAIKKAVPAEEIPINGSRVRIIKQLGEGGYAFVYLVEDVNTGRKYALKKMMAADGEQKAVAKTEVNIMRSFKNAPNLVKYYDSCVKTIQNKRISEYYILMELCERGALLDEITERIENDRPYSERNILRMFKQTCIAVKFFHTRKPPIQHRDLKIENLLMTRDGTIKLCDFGSCTVRSKKYTTRSEILQEEERIQKYTTNCYMAPEMADLYKHEVISEKVDIWALGCILYVFAFFLHPFQDKGTLAIINGAYDVPKRHNYSDVLMWMIKGLLVAKPTKRPDIHMVLTMIDDWEKFLNTGKKPQDRKTHLSVADKKDRGASSASEMSGSDDEERRRRKKEKKKKKLEKKKKKEQEKKAREEAMRRAAARAKARHERKKSGRKKSPTSAARRTPKSRSQSDDFEVDWSKGKSQVDDAQFDVDWGEGDSNAAQTNNNNNTAAQNQPPKQPKQQQNNSSSKLEWDPFSGGGGGGRYFRKPKPAATEAKTDTRTPQTA